MGKYYWPRDNVDLYKVTNQDNIITLNTNGEISNLFYLYSGYYVEAANIITKITLESGSIRDLDFYFFSLAYQYRHSLELILKAIGFQYITDYKNRINFMKDTKHNLLKILEIISSYIDLENDEVKESYKWLTRLFQDMDTIDRESDCFRYPFGLYKSKERRDRSKRYKLRVFFNEQTHIDLIKFAKKMIVAREILISYYNSTQIPKWHKDYTPIFIEAGGSYYAQSVIYTYNKDTFRIHVSAFHEGAGILAKVIQENIGEKQHLFMPMCYLYRNSIELALKQIIFEQCTFEKQQQRALHIMNHRKHSLEGLWNSAKKQIEHSISLSSEEKELIDKYVRILHELDLKADTFRYPVNISLDAHFKSDTTMDMKNVTLFFEEFHVLLNLVYTRMDQYNQYLAEMQASQYCWNL